MRKVSMGQKKYDGMTSFPHLVQPGETLVEIAQVYRFASFDPIWVYNTQIEKTLGPNPDEIRAGTLIIIPRSAAGYRKMIVKLTTVKLKTQANLLSLGADLDKANVSATSMGEGVDLLAEIAKAGIEFHGLAKDAAKAMETALATTGRGRVAARYLADQATKKIADWTKKQIAGAVTKGGLEALDEHFARGDGVLAKRGRDAQASMKLARAIESFSTQGGKFAFDVIDVLLDYLEPSALAAGYARMTLGAWPKDAYNLAAKTIADALDGPCRQLDERIQHFEDERVLLYGSAAST